MVNYVGSLTTVVSGITCHSLCLYLFYLCVAIQVNQSVCRSVSLRRQNIEFNIVVNKEEGAKIITPTGLLTDSIQLAHFITHIYQLILTPGAYAHNKTTECLILHENCCQRRLCRRTQFFFSFFG